MNVERFHAATTLLAAFSLQLAGELNRLLLAEENVESPAIARAKQYINAHLDERITLDDVAQPTFASVRSTFARSSNKRPA